MASRILTIPPVLGTRAFQNPKSRSHQKQNDRRLVSGDGEVDLRHSPPTAANKSVRR